MLETTQMESHRRIHIGNHDSNYFRNNPERFSKEETARLYLRECDKCYYYMDYPAQRLRMVFLDSFDPAEEIRYGFSEEVLDWLEEVLAQTMPDWYVLVCSHVPPTPRIHYWSKEIRGSHRLLGILRDFQSRTAKTEQRTGGEDVSGNASHGHLLGFVHGHNHADQVDYEEGFPIISIGCNKCEYFEDKKPQGAIVCERELGAVSQDLWDVLAVSVKDGTLDFIRFGAGENRHISLKECQGR